MNAPSITTERRAYQAPRLREIGRAPVARCNGVVDVEATWRAIGAELRAVPWTSVCDVTVNKPSLVETARHRAEDPRIDLFDRRFCYHPLRQRWLEKQFHVPRPATKQPTGPAAIEREKRRYSRPLPRFTTLDQWRDYQNIRPTILRRARYRALYAWGGLVSMSCVEDVADVACIHAVADFDPNRKGASLEGLAWTNARNAVDDLAYDEGLREKSSKKTTFGE